MHRFRIFRSPANEWVSPLVGIARGLVSIGNCVPFPYVNTALSAGLTLLELIQTVGQSDEDLKYLSESVVTIMRLLRTEVESHPTENTPFREVCEEFTSHLTQLSKEIELMSKNRSSSKLRKYLNSQNIRDEISRFARRVTDLRANATLVAATGTRMDLAGVESRISDLIVSQNSSRKMDSADGLKQELARLDDDFHTLKLGDIHLDFGSARSNLATYFNDREEKEIGWTDYKATVNGGVRTVRVYQGSDPTESWKDFLFFLADHSPSANLPQLFGFCSSPRLRCLVFHGEYRTLDEYGATLTSAEAIVDWELTLVADFADLLDEHGLHAIQSREFAMVHGHNGRLMISHIEKAGLSRTTWDLTLPYFGWFVHSPRRSATRSLHQCRQIAASEWDMRTMLESLVNIQRRIEFLQSSDKQSSCYRLLLSRGCVYRHDRCESRPSFHCHWPRFAKRIAAFTGRSSTPDDSWAALDMLSNGAWQKSAYQGHPMGRDDLESGFTHFTVSLKRKWQSNHDQKAHSGYFLRATMEFGDSVPDVTHAWLAQASSILKALDKCCPRDPSDFYIPTVITLDLTWEMVLAAEDAAILDDLPGTIHVFVQVPQINEDCVDEPQIHWSTDADAVKTQTIPRSALKIRMKWMIGFVTVRWEKHHYEVAEATQRQLGFDPTTNAAAKSLNLPLLEVVDGESPEWADPGTFYLYRECVFIVPP
ncbi:hypothetical protein C8R47DRAFT_1127890 [Mycena vitilis]|nr:hypothetical protein C8R47DRAFT_1127890 [Mycena vitilis]